MPQPASNTPISTLNQASAQNIYYAYFQSVKKIQTNNTKTTVAMQHSTLYTPLNNNFATGLTNMFNNIKTADFSAFGAPVQKLIELNTATMTKAFELQQAAAKKQMAQSQASLKAALEIKDAKGLTSFVTEQSEIAKTTLEALKANTQVSVEASKAYFAEVQAILAETKDTVVKAATQKTA